MSIVDQVLKFVTHEGVAPFCDYLRKLPARYQRGGLGAPRDFPWYVTTARDFASKQSTQKATTDLCQHGRPYNVCCLPPEQFDRISEAF